MSKSKCFNVILWISETEIQIWIYQKKITCKNTTYQMKIDNFPHENVIFSRDNKPFSFQFYHRKETKKSTWQMCILRETKSYCVSSNMSFILAYLFFSVPTLRKKYMYACIICIYVFSLSYRTFHFRNNAPFAYDSWQNNIGLNEFANGKIHLEPYISVW